MGIGETNDTSKVWNARGSLKAILKMIKILLRHSKQIKHVGPRLRSRLEEELVVKWF